MESGVNVLVSRWAARKAVTGCGLPPTRSNINLYLSSRHARAVPEPLPASADLPAIPDDAPFSANWRYGDLFTDGRLTIGVYLMAPSSPDALGDLVGDHAAGPGRTVTLRLLHSRQDLVEAFACDTIVLYSGHANFGKGIAFDHRSGEAPIPMGQDTLLVPANHLAPADEILERLDHGMVRIRGGCQGFEELNVQCKVFGHLGCRTDLYYREVWKSHFPHVDFVATTYATHSGAAPGILRHWILGLQRGRPLAAIVEDMNQRQSAAILFGRMEETTRYHNTDRHSGSLFTY